MNKHFFRRNIILNTIPFVLAIAVYVAVRLSVDNPLRVEQYYSKGLYPVIAGFVSWLSSLVKFSLYDFSWVFMSLFILTGLILVFMKKLKPGRYFLRLGQFIAILYALFYLLWGFNYFRPDLKSRLGWSEFKADEATFRVVLDSIISATNRTYTIIKPHEYFSVDTETELSYSKCSDILLIDYPNGKRVPKNMLVSSYFAKSGVSGYFAPFFNEVHINYYELPEDYPFITAHEKAHQFGIANEADANLAAFIVCTSSADKRLRFSGFLQILLYFLNDARNMPEYKSILASIDKDVINLIMARAKYYSDLRNKKLQKVQVAANDLYLKTQNIEQGVKNYNQVVALTISWYAQTGKLPVTPGSIFAGVDEK